MVHNACALTTVPDPSLIQRLESEGVRKLEMLGRGADTTLFHPKKRDAALRQSWGADENDIVALYVGRAAAEKDIPLSLEAWTAAKEARPSMKMVVVGDGPVRRRLQAKWPDVCFAGMRYDEDLARHYASADIFIFGSTSETFGNVVIEAMASGLAVLTYDYAAAHQFIRPGENGLLVPLNHREAFLAECKRCVGRPEVLPALGHAARQTAEDYPWQKTIDQFEKLLLQAAKRERDFAKFDIVPDVIDSISKT